jgi:hypothetical protein
MVLLVPRVSFLPPRLIAMLTVETDVGRGGDVVGMRGDGDGAHVCLGNEWIKGF